MQRVARGMLARKAIKRSLAGIALASADFFSSGYPPFPPALSPFLADKDGTLARERERESERSSDRERERERVSDTQVGGEGSPI